MNILLILSSILLNSAAQLLIRKGMLAVGKISASNVLQSIIPMVSNIYLWLAMLCYSVSIFLWMAVLSKVETSYAVPFQSVGFVVVALAGYFLFNENVSYLRIIGILVICAGVYLVSRS
ncbi:MAG: EamA family transporter [Fibromonadaceae bacterium]|nr:EamA family transporter [Fibromonadaceae bacterium]